MEDLSRRKFTAQEVIQILKEAGQSKTPKTSRAYMRENAQGVRSFCSVGLLLEKIRLEYPTDYDWRPLNNSAYEELGGVACALCPTGSHPAQVEYYNECQTMLFDDDTDGWFRRHFNNETPFYVLSDFNDGSPNTPESFTELASIIEAEL